MQRPATMTWSTPKTIGSEIPSKRSGHSWDLVGDVIYMFGGNDSMHSPPGPNNEMYKLDISSADFFWEKVIVLTWIYLDYFA